MPETLSTVHEPSPEELPPTQQQLRDLWGIVLEREPKVEPFAGLPSKAPLEEYDTNLSDFEILAGPPSYDETLAPALTLRAPDKRVIWLSVFRNPDTNDVTRQYLMVIDPPVNRKTREEIPREDYEIIGSPNASLEVTFNGSGTTTAQVEGLRQLIQTAEPFNAFVEI